METQHWMQRVFAQFNDIKGLLTADPRVVKNSFNAEAQPEIKDLEFYDL